MLQPHPIQVLSILRFIGCDQKDSLISSFIGLNKFGIGVNKIPNHLMQILTGQGKSVTLGMMLLILALMRHEIFTVCYS